MIEITSMEISYKTKARETGGSLVTTIPMAIVKGLNINTDDQLIWTMKITEKGATLTITIEPKKEEKKD